MTVKRKRIPTQDGVIGFFLVIEFERGEVQEWILHPTIQDGAVMLEWQVAGTLGGLLLDAVKELEESDKPPDGK